MNNRQRGFTLLEVLVAFVILAMALGVLTRIVSLSARSLATAGHHQHALALAASQLAELTTELDSTRSQRLQGQLPGAYAWEASIQPYSFDSGSRLEDDRITPMLISIRVSWGEQASQSVSLATLRLLEENR